MTCTCGEINARCPEHGEPFIYIFPLKSGVVHEDGTFVRNRIECVSKLEYDAIKAELEVAVAIVVALKSDNSLMDKVKCCATCGYPGNNHFEKCKAALNE